MKLDIEVFGDADSGTPVKRATVVPSESGGLFLAEGTNADGEEFRDLISRRIGLIGLTDEDIRLLDRKITSPELHLTFDQVGGGVVSASEKLDMLVAELDDETLARGGTWRAITSFREFGPVRPSL
jgi:hypothetical protein